MVLQLRKLIPKEPADRFGFGAALVLITSVTINCLIKLNSKMESDFQSTLVLLAFGLFILFNVLGNMYKAIRVDTTIYSLELPVVLLPEWRFCSACEQNAPPRAYHCFTCNKCVLKRHNHCMFLGKCIGNNNLRYYLMFIVYVWLGTLISNIINQEYFVTAFGNIGFKQSFIVFMPLFAFCFGMLSLVDLFFVFTNSVCMILFFLMFFYMFINLKMALMGQTWHEKAKGITIYNLGLTENALQFLGSNWISALVNPLSKLNLPSNGSKFKTNVLDQQPLYSMDEIYKANSEFMLKKRENVKYV